MKIGLLYSFLYVFLLAFCNSKSSENLSLEFIHWPYLYVSLCCFLTVLEKKKLTNMRKVYLNLEWLGKLLGFRSVRDALTPRSPPPPTSLSTKLPGVAETNTSTNKLHYTFYNYF